MGYIEKSFKPCITYMNCNNEKNVQEQEKTLTCSKSHQHSIVIKGKDKKPFISFMSIFQNKMIKGEREKKSFWVKVSNSELANSNSKFMQQKRFYLGFYTYF